jgi:hypothetical protein
MLPRQRRPDFDPSLHTSIASLLTGFAALVLSIHGWTCQPLPPHLELSGLPVLPSPEPRPGAGIRNP